MHLTSPTESFAGSGRSPRRIGNMGLQAAVESTALPSNQQRCPQQREGPAHGNCTCPVPLVRLLTFDTLLISARAGHLCPSASKSNKFSFHDLRFDNSR
jgi:hypothetical protein